MRKTVLALFFLCLMVFPAQWCRVRAQSGNAVIDGIIADPSGAVVPECDVSLLNLATGGILTTQSNAAGVYIFPSVTAGSYTLTVTKQGFKTYSISDFRVTIGQHVTQNVALELGTTSQSITIEARGSSPLLEPTSNELGTLIEPVSVQQLPLNGRNFLQLGLLSGAAQEGGTGVSNFLSAQTGHENRDITIAGIQQDLTGYTVNGIATGGSRLGDSALNVSISAIDQFKVVQGFFLPALGASPGMVNVVTKSGTNGFHGEVFEFIRNNALDARNFFDPEPRPGPFRRNQFGGALGGPILKNRLFFFADYEGLRQVRSETQRAFAPSAKMFGGDFSEVLPIQIYDPASFDSASGQRLPFPGNIIPADRINPMAQKLLAYYLPGSSYAERPLNVAGNPKATENSDQFGLRLDYHLGTKHTLYGQYIRENSPVFNRGLFPLSGPAYLLNTQLTMLQLTSTLSPNLVNEFRLGWTRPLLFFTGERQEGLQEALGFTGTADQSGPPGITLDGIGAFGRSQSMIGNIDNTFQLQDSLNYLRGSHEIKFGTTVRHIRTVQESSNFNARGTVVFSQVFSAQLTRDTDGQLSPMPETGNSFADFLLGMPVSGTVTSMPRTHFHWTEWEPYIQDTWRLRRGLTANLGFGWYVATPPNPSGNDRNYPHAFDFQTGKVLYAALGQVRPQIIETDWNNFAPRLGLAWQPSFTKRLVIRAGAGIYYPPQRALYQLFAITAPGVSIVQSIVNDQHEPMPTYVLGQNVFPPISQVPITQEFADNLTGTVFALDTKARTTYVPQWNLSIQYALTDASLVEVNYIGSVSRKLTNRWNANDCSIFDSLRCDPSVIPWPRYAYVFFAANEANSSYHALAGKFQRQFSQGFSFLANYTWSKVLTNTMQGGATSPLNQRAACRACDKGMAGFNVPHRLVTSLVWEIPLGKGQRFLRSASPLLNHAAAGWTLNAMSTFSHGIPLSISAPNRTAAVLTSFRADRHCNGRTTLTDTNLRTNGLYWIDPACFAAPDQDYFGDSGANILTGPGLNNWDIGIQKDLTLHENLRIQFRTELFNAWNHAQFESPNNNVADVNFGRVTKARDAREIQFGLKLLW